MRRLVVAITIVAAGLVSPATASPSARPELSRAGQPVTWSGTLTTSDPLGCGEVISTGCDHTALNVRALRGTWITIKAEGPSLYLHVSSGGTDVGAHGTQPLSLNHPSDGTPSVVTFQQIRSGLVSYDVGVSSFTVSPQTPVPYRGDARLAGQAFDRQGSCLVGKAGVDHLLDSDDGRPLEVTVRLISDPQDAAAMHAIARGLIDMYDRINVRMKLSFATMPLTGYVNYPYEVAQKAYRGMKPAGVDVVYVGTDRITGGFGDCIGGIAYRERGFATGGLTFRGLPINQPAAGALIAGHEIGHELGGQHQQVSCVEAIPQQVLRPAKDGWYGACTLMGPTAYQTSETFSTLERTTIRAYIRAFAGRS